MIFTTSHPETVPNSKQFLIFADNFTSLKYKQSKLWQTYSHLPSERN